MSVFALLKKIELFIYGLWHLLIEVRRIKYLNNIVEQDHRGIKNITKYTLGFKSFESAEATIAGIELRWMLNGIYGRDPCLEAVL
jgi:putative transposase